MPKANEQSGAVEVTPEMYARVFETHHEGRLVLEDLANRFGGNPYRKGGLEAARQTDFGCGENNVINWITSQVNRAGELPAATEENDA